MLFTFTIDGTEYLPFDNSLYVIEEEITDVNELQEGHAYRYHDMVGKFDIPSREWKSHNAVFIPFEYPEQKVYFTGPESRSGKDFTKASRLARLTPDQIIECPECGEWAGSIEESDAPKCVHCGYGMD